KVQRSEKHRHQQQLKRKPECEKSPVFALGIELQTQSYGDKSERRHRLGKAFPQILGRFGEIHIGKQQQQTNSKSNKWPKFKDAFYNVCGRRFLARIG